MHQEAFAYAKYILFAEHTRQSAILSWHKLLEKAAREVLREHFTEEAGLAGFVRSDAENLEDAIQRESYAIETMYRDFAQQAFTRATKPSGIALKRFATTK